MRRVRACELSVKRIKCRCNYSASNWQTSKKMTNIWRDFFLRFFRLGFCFCRLFFFRVPLDLEENIFMSYDGRAITISMCSMLDVSPLTALRFMPNANSCAHHLRQRRSSFFSSSSCHLREKNSRQICALQTYWEQNGREKMEIQ